ncbi:hypothetical protein [Streptomyces sp. NPDC057429]|uniref:hypothetical protein n=1 Tax=Streptomyces sp. NPDC057429 TaxID=3346130 RepID=UPI0036768A54
MTEPTLRDRVHAALAAEYQRRIERQIVASPEGHIDGFTDAVMAAISEQQLRATVRSWLPALSRAIDCLDTTCRYHGENTDPDRVGREACCDTGVEPHRHAAAAHALAALTELATTEV